MKYWLYQDWFSILGKQCEYVHCCMWRFCQCFDLLCVFFFFVPERQHFKHVPFRAHVNCATVSADYTPPAIIKLKMKSFTAMATYEKLNAVMPPCAPKTRSVWMKVPQPDMGVLLAVDSTDLEWKRVVWVTWQSFNKLLTNEAECSPWEIT